MEYRFELTPRARLQAHAAYEWMAEQSPTRAAKWYQGLFRKIETLQTFPTRCPRAAESDFFGVEVRELLYGKRRYPYRILFTIDGEVIRVLAVRHSAQGPIQ